MGSFSGYWLNKNGFQFRVLAKQQQVQIHGTGETTAGSNSGYWLDNSGFQLAVAVKQQRVSTEGISATAGSN